MGAEYFQVKSTGATIDEAFRKAVDEAQYNYGHRGYTGTIAEKSSYTLHRNLTGMDPEKLITHIMDTNKDAWNKWGPANAIEVAPNTWVFFGYASS